MDERQLKIKLTDILDAAATRLDTEKVEDYTQPVFTYRFDNYYLGETLSPDVWEDFDLRAESVHINVERHKEGNDLIVEMYDGNIEKHEII